MATQRYHNPPYSYDDLDRCPGCSKLTEEDVQELIVDLNHHTIRYIDFTVFKLAFGDSTFRHTGIRLHVYRADGSVDLFVHEVTGGSGSVKYNPLSSAPKSVLVLRPIQSHHREMSPSKAFRFARVDYKLHRHILPVFKTLFDYSWNYNLVFNNCRDQVVFFAEKLQSIGIKVEAEVFDFIRDVKFEDGGLVRWHWVELQCLDYTVGTSIRKNKSGKRG